MQLLVCSGFKFAFWNFLECFQVFFDTGLFESADVEGGLYSAQRWPLCSAKVWERLPSGTWHHDCTPSHVVASNAQDCRPSREQKAGGRRAAPLLAECSQRSAAPGRGWVFWVLGCRMHVPPGVSLHMLPAYSYPLTSGPPGMVRCFKKLIKSKETNKFGHKFWG